MIQANNYSWQIARSFGWCGLFYPLGDDHNFSDVLLLDAYSSNPQNQYLIQIWETDIGTSCNSLSYYLDLKLKKNTFKKKHPIISNISHFSDVYFNLHNLLLRIPFPKLHVTSPISFLQPVSLQWHHFSPPNLQLRPHHSTPPLHMLFCEILLGC